MIKKLAGSIRQYWVNALLTPTFVMFEVIIDVVMPLLMAKLIDFGVNKGDMGYVLKMGVVLIGCSLLSLLFGSLSGSNAAIGSNGFASNLRHDMFHIIQDFSFSNIDKFSTGSLVTRLTTDVTRVQMSFQMLTRMAFRAPLMLIFSMIMTFSINGRLALIFLGCIPVLAIGLWLISSHTHPIFNRVFKTYDKLNTVVQENLHGVRVVKSFVREDYETEKFNAISDSIAKDFTKAEQNLALNGPLMQFCTYTCTLLISWFGAHLIVKSGGDPDIGLSTGQLMSLISYVMQILGSLMMLSMMFVMITMSRASGERIVEVLEEKSDLVNCENPKYEVADGSIEFRDVSFAYSGRGATPCLKDIDLSIPSGSSVGILGVTGSSKSTLVQLIPRLYDVTEGSVMVGGVDVRDYDIETLRQNVAMVLQKNVLFSGTIKENIRWGDENASDEDIERVCRLAAADEFIRDFPNGYDTYIEQGGTNVSGGQKQRLCIARALLKKPKILILDDSTSAVDTATDARIRAAFATEIPDTTKLIIAQRISSVKDCDMIIVMDDGTIKAKGTHEELMKTSEDYRDVYRSQNKLDSEQTEGGEQ